MDNQERTTAQAIIIDSLQRKLTVEEACNAAGISRRTAYNWRLADSVFAAAWDAAVEDSGQLVSQRQVADWGDELAALEAELVELDARLADVLAPALCGDEASQVKRAEIDKRRADVAARIDALNLAIQSGETHLERQAADKAEQEKSEFVAKAEELLSEQREAAQEIDDCFRRLEAAWARHKQAEIARSVAVRRSGGRGRVVGDRLLVGSAFACAPNVAGVLRLDRRLRNTARPIAELLNQ